MVLSRWVCVSLQNADKNISIKEKGTIKIYTRGFTSWIHKHFLSGCTWWGAASFYCDAESCRIKRITHSANVIQDALPFIWLWIPYGKKKKKKKKDEKGIHNTYYLGIHSTHNDIITFYPSYHNGMSRGRTAWTG